MEIKDLNSLVQAAEKTAQKLGAGTWWRGLSISKWDLQTRLYRENRDADEHNFAQLFRNQAGVRHGKCPQYDDSPEWLSLMQHYGLPTRLLDWTESCLIGLFFAVRNVEHHDKPGALWGLYPGSLNKNQGYPAAILTAHGSEPLCSEAFDSPPKTNTQKICAIGSPHFDPRQLMQSSVFTIHSISTALNKLPIWGNFMEKHTIPAHAKGDLLNWLNFVGINEKFVFPDLEHLAKDIGSRQYK